MKAKGNFISCLLVIDTFLIAYAAGFNSHPVLIVDPLLPPLPKPGVKAAVPSKKSSDKTAANSDGKTAEHSGDKITAGATDKTAGHGGVKTAAHPAETHAAHPSGKTGGTAKPTGHDTSHGSKHSGQGTSSSHSHSGKTSPAGQPHPSKPIQSPD